MKKLPEKLLVFGMLLTSATAWSQCVTITCPSNITTPNDAGNCSAIVNFTAPVGTNTCGSTQTTTFNYLSPALQTFTVPPGVTSINIDASGAQGGSVTTSCAATGGLGARMVGDFSVTPGEVLSIMVGQQGLTNGSDAGGGGGTFVVRTGNVLLVAAGGGGGATNNIGQCGGNRNGVDATITTSGTASANGVIAGGINGNGGGASGGSGGGGGGFLTDGVAGTGLPGNNGKCYLNGGAGGNGNNNDFGGYGGGGAGWFTGGNGGGGGGYSGGGTSGSQPFSGGGGGGSYSIGTNQNNSAGFQSGNGRVIISYTTVGSATTTQIAGLASGSSFPVGVTTQTFAVTDGVSSFDTCSFTITVQDMEAPVITCPSNITVSNDSALCGAFVSFSTAGATDNCASPTIAQTSGLASGSLFPLGTSTITYSATDAAGNVSTCSFDIIVNDTEAPVITCAGNMTVAADSGMCTAVVNYNAPSATDNCSSASVSLTSGPASGSTFPLGTTTITYTATDSAGNTSTCSFDVIVTDQEAPVLVCPGTMTVPSDSGNCTAVVTFSAPSATDNCSGATVTQTGGLTSGSTFPAGTSTITFTAVDSAGNTSTCSFDVVVTDAEAPTIVCPQDISSCSAAISGIAASAADMCSGIASITYTQSGATTGSGTGDASGNYNVGATTVTYTATDSAGNSITCSFTVTVFPDPTLTVSASDNSVCIDDANVTLTGTPAGGTWTGPGVTGSSFDPSVAGNGTQSLIYSYTDSNGCSNTAQLSIVVSACVGIAEAVGFENLQVFPNPVQDVVNVLFGGEYKKVEVRLSQMNGQLIRTEQINNASQLQLSTSDLAAGVYFLTIKADDQLKTVRLIKQ